jgi:hypothetical protein
VLANEERIRR